VSAIRLQKDPDESSDSEQNRESTP